MNDTGSKPRNSDETPSLLELDDTAIEDVMAAAHFWCQQSGASMASNLGQKAVHIAIRYRRDAPLTARQLLQILMQQL
ncbi:hypothetical protein [Neorhizobium sp. NCHU2750]|uniref:hypothetical protein n=1 Tax=Neorhizobium sp. NCHU2750 TaxID=1825976 RepID=UPI000E71B1EE